MILPNSFRFSSALSILNVLGTPFAAPQMAESELVAPLKAVRKLKTGGSLGGSKK
jgi:hypothetical protein